MDKWITLHHNNGKRIFNINKFYVIEENSTGGSNIYETVQNYTDGTYFVVKESPAEILAMLNEPETELRQAARELIDEMNYTHCGDLANSEVLREKFKKLETLLEKP